MEAKRGSPSSGTPQGTCGAGQAGTEWTPMPLGCPGSFADRLAPGRTMEAAQPYYQAPTAEVPQPRHQHLLAAGPYRYSRAPYPAFPQPPSHVSAPNHDPGPEGRPWRFGVQAEGLRAPDPFLAAHQARPHHGKKAGGPSFRHYTQGALSPRDEALLKERKARKPGRHICQYCGRACAKPSVLKKHIRSHTGERPFPCVPCGFSFKTKSNLYKHRKSHAHAIKAGLVPALEPGGEGSAPELPSEGDESTDTDEEVRLGGQPSSPAVPHGVGEAYLRPAGGVPESEEPAPPHPPIKVPILIVPGALGGAAAVAVQNEASASAKAGPGQGPGLGDERGGQWALKQKLALRLSEKQGQDSEQSLNLLSPHSKGSTDSGYFSRSESSEQQASPPNTNAKSYAEIIFGKFARLVPRTVVANMAAQDLHSASGIQEKPGLAPLSFPKPDAEKLIRAMGLGEALAEPAAQKSWRFFLPEEELLAHPEVCRLGVPSESSPLVRSNSMPITTGSGLAVPQVLRGSHSFDERIATSDEVCPTASGLSPHQRLLKRQAAIELFPGLEAPSLSDDPEAGHNLLRPGAGVPKDEEGFPGEAEAKMAPACAFECEACGVKYQIWDNFEAHRKFYCAPPQGTRPKALAHRSSGEAFPGLSQAQPHPKAGQGSENLPFRKRRKEKSVGDEDELGDDYGSAYSSSSTSLASLCDSRAESLEQEPVARGIAVLATGPPRGANGYRYPSHLGCVPADCPSKAEEREGPSIEEGPAACETWPASPQACRRPGGNEISVIQHTNSLSRPSSFERSESMEVTPLQPGNASPSGHQEGLRPEQAEACLAGLSQVLVGLSPQPKLVRQHNIQVPEIRVTEEPDKPEKDPEPVAKEPEKVTEEFQWPQRSETLSQLPAEKLPPKKKRLRLAEMEYSSGESSFESGPLSRSPSQESNWSHSSSFSLSLDREEGLKALELGRAPAEYLTVPSGASGLQQKEMRRSASEQTPCQPCMEAAESRSKSFDYGSLSAGQCPAASSPPMAAERRKCFLVRQATLSQYSEGLQAELGPEVAEPMQLSQAYPPQAPRRRSPSPCAWLPGNEAPLQIQALPAFPLQLQALPAFPGPLPVDAEAWPAEARLQTCPGTWEREARQHSSSSPSSPCASPQHCPSRLPKPQPQLLVPVRIQAHVPSYGSVTYTSVSHHTPVFWRAAPGKVEEQAARGGPGELSRIFGAQPATGPAERPDLFPPSGLGLGEASPPAGGSKRVLSPASSLELVLERQRQKRIKEERICGQLMEKLSLREHSPGRAAKPQLVRQRRTTELREAGPPPSPHEPRPRSAIAADADSPPSPDLLAQHASSEPQPFPSLRGTVAVSWCFLSLAKPNHARQAGPRSSIYASWCVSSYNPNPPGTPTKVALALLRSRQAAGPHVYIMAAHAWPTGGKLVASSGWKQRLTQMKWYESSQQESDRTGRNAAGSLDKEQEKIETGVAKDHGSKIMEPTRVKIFDGGYKSNEDYVYVRGRGRGKYICEECGIRCKKPSMLKKHIRTHTDLRPFMCKFCNFAFKTKGNLTKHMKSKAHTKKCLELGIAITCMYSTDTEETGIPDETEQEALSEVPVLHQFSDPEDTDGAEEEGDEDEDDEDEDEDDRQGDSTPTTRSRSASPSARGAKPPSSTFSIASASPFDAPHSSSQSSLDSYLVTVPQIQVTQLNPHSYSYAGTALTDYQRQLHNRLMESVEYKERLVPAATSFWRSQNEDGSSREDSSREMSPSGDTGSSAHPSPVYEGSPGRDTSPTSRRYLSPRRDLSPRPHLSPRREMSPLRHRSPKREGYLSEWSPKQEASPHRHFLPRREISSPRLASPVKDLSPRRDASPRRDYRERRHMPSLRTTSPRRGSFQSEHAMGHFVQHSDINLRQSQQNLYDTSRATAWSWYSDNAQGDQSHSLLSEAQTGCLFTHLPLHSQQQVRAPYHMIPIGGIQMVQTGASAFPGILPASQLPLRRRRREENIIDEATHCVIESIKEMDIFSKAEETPAPSPMAISPPRPNAAEGSPGTAQLGERERGPGEDQAPQRLLDQARAYAAQPRADGAPEAFERPHPPENDRGREKAAYQPQGPEPSGGPGPCHNETPPSFPRQHAEVYIGGEGSLDSRPGNPNGTR